MTSSGPVIPARADTASDDRPAAGTPGVREYATAFVQAPPSTELVVLPSFGDGRGILVSIEGLALPFPIARVYTIIPEQDHPRGFHAHYALYQYMICVSGGCRVVLDNGRERREVLLDRPDRALPVGPMTWREMHDWKPGTVLMVLASLPYDEADYIRDYDRFLAEARR